MPSSPSSLPDDIEALKALLMQRDGEVQQLRDAVTTLELALNVRSLEIEQLKLQLAKLKRMQFGRKSEKLDRKIEQLETRLEDLIAEDGASEQKAAAAHARKFARQPLPAHLPREDNIIEPPNEACDQAISPLLEAITRAITTSCDVGSPGPIVRSPREHRRPHHRGFERATGC